MLQFIVVYHTDVRVHHRCPDIAHVVVDTVYFKDLIHPVFPLME